MRRPFQVVLIALLVAGSGCQRDCDESVKWSDVEYHSSEPGEDAQAILDLGRHAVEQVAAWSGRSRSCVTAVEVIALDGPVDGDFGSKSGLIELDLRIADPWSVTIHEVCHAIDLADGLSNDARDLFPDDAVSDEYKGKRERAAEAFADMCESGAFDVDRWDYWNACGDPYIEGALSGYRFIQDRAFPEGERFPWGEGTFTAEVGEPWALGPTDEGWSAKGMEATTEGLLVLYESTLGSRDVRAVWRSPADGSVVHAVEFDPCPDDIEGCGVDLIPGDDGAWLWTSSPTDYERLGRVSFEGAEPSEMPCAGFRPERVIGTTGWQAVTGWHSNELEAVGCDFETGEVLRPAPYVTQFPLSTAYISFSSPSITTVGSSVAVRWSSVGVGRLQADGSWTEVALPWHLAIGSVTPLGGDVWLATVETWSDLQQRWFLSLVQIDAGTGELAVPENACPIEIRGSKTYGRYLYSAGDWVVMTEGTSKDDADFWVIPIVVGS